MRRPSGRCTINQVLTRKVLGWTGDGVRSRQAVYGPASGPFACSVQPSSAVDVPSHLRESAVIYHTVIFHDDPRLSIRDQVLWESKVLTATGVLNSSGRSRSWKVLCEERPVA